MPTKAELTALVDGDMAGSYETSAPRGIPKPADIGLGKKAAKLEATSLFIDVRQSSDITNTFRRQTAAKMLKSYYDGAVRIIGSHDGEVVSFNGDGMLALFIGGSRTTQAVDSAQQVDWFIAHILWPKFNRYFDGNEAARGQRLNFSVGCGIDDGGIYAVRIGIRGTNDIAWVGRCTNTSAKLSNILHRPANIAVTRAAYSRLRRPMRYSAGQHMWSEEKFETFGGTTRAYRTTTRYQAIS